VCTYGLSLPGLVCNSIFKLILAFQPCLSLTPKLNAKPKLLAKLVLNSYQLLLLNKQPPLQLVLLQLVHPLVVDPPDLHQVLLQVHQIPVLRTKTHLIPQLAILAIQTICHPVVILMVMAMVTVIRMKTMTSQIYETI
jgi:hypothetical protein